MFIMIIPIENSCVLKYMSQFNCGDLLLFYFVGWFSNISTLALRSSNDDAPTIGYSSHTIDCEYCIKFSKFFSMAKHDKNH